MSAILDRYHAERTSVLDAVDSVIDAAESEERDLSDAERELIARSHARVDEIDAQIEPLEGLAVIRAKHNAHVPGVPARLDDPEPAGAPGSEVVYRSFASYARDLLICRYDVIAQRAGSGARADAEERLSRVVANTLTADVAGLVPPQYLTQIAQLIDASRPIVDSARRVALTSGTLVYPSITQRPSVGKQATEKTETASQKMTVQFVSSTADTYAGSGDISWQAMNWSSPEVLGLWFDLAAEQYAIQTEAAAGTVLAAATAMATPAIPATPALADWMSAITAAAGVIYGASRRRPDTVYADIASGYGIMGLVANVAPVFFPAGDFSLRSGQGNVGGLRLVISGGLPAKTVVVGNSQSLIAAETAGAPVELRAVEPALGGMEVGVIGAFVAKITDAGAFRKLTIA